MTIQGIAVTIFAVIPANLVAAAEQVGPDRPVTFPQIASEHGIKLEHLAEKLNLDLEKIRLKRPQDVGVTVARSKRLSRASRRNKPRPPRTQLRPLSASSWSV